MKPTLSELEEAAARVHAVLPATPQYAWPLLAARVGAEVWLKHEGHLPTGAFKVRGGVLLMDRLRESGVTQVIAATRGNHGQSVAFGAARAGIRATIVVPDGNSPDKNRAMAAYGAQLVTHGHDFQAALEEARRRAESAGLHFVPSFGEELVLGVASYALELFRAAPPLHTVYVPIGLGSGICGVIAARDALGLTTDVVGVVAEEAPCYALSFEAGRAVATASANTMADGIACRIPDEAALAMILRGAARVVTVTEAGIRAAMRALFADTHHVSEGAGAAALAAALKERDQIAGKRIAVILSGANVDARLFAEVLGEEG